MQEQGYKLSTPGAGAWKTPVMFDKAEEYEAEIQTVRGALSQPTVLS